MMMRADKFRRPAGIAVVAAALVLGGCGAGSDPTSTSAPPVRAASWAEAVVTGTELWRVSSDGLTLTAYSMGEDTATMDSNFSDDVTDRPLVATGDPILFVNLVLTNTGDQTRYVANDQPGLLAAPEESPYTEQGVAEVTRAWPSQFRDHDVWYHSARPDAEEFSPYPLAPGESCAMGYILPLGLGSHWGFVGTVWVYGGVDEDGFAVDSGRAVTFEPQEYTFG